MVPICSLGQGVSFGMQHDHTPPHWWMTWPWPRVKFHIDLWVSSHTYFASPRRKQQKMYSLCSMLSLCFLIQKLYKKLIPKHFIVDDLWWPQYWPDPKMFMLKVVDFSTPYQMPFAICRSDVWFFRSEGGPKRPPPRIEPFRARARNRVKWTNCSLLGKIIF